MSSQFSYAQSLGFFQSEWSSVLFLFFVGAMYFLAPVAGYAAHRRGILLAALWTMIVKLAIGTFRESLIGVQVMYAAPAPMAWNAGPPVPGAGGQQAMWFSPTNAGGASGLLGKFEEQLPALLTLAEGVVFLAAFALFIYGLQKLVRREPPQRLAEAPESGQKAVI